MSIAKVPSALGLPGSDSLWQFFELSEQFILSDPAHSSDVVEDEEERAAYNAPVHGREADQAPVEAASVTVGDAREGIVLPTAFAAPSVSVEIDTAAAALPPAETGTPGVGIATVARSNYKHIDGLLSGVKWNSGAITYSDLDSTSDYGAGYPAKTLTGFSGLSTGQMAAVHETLNVFNYGGRPGHYGFSVEGFTNLTIDYMGPGVGDSTMRFGNNTDANTAYAYYPDTTNTGGDVWFGQSGVSPTAGNYDYATVIHEIGHALGLKHGHEAGGYGALPFETDSMEYSVMTYKSYVGPAVGYYTNETWGYAQTFMMYDIAALQYMYGADFGVNGGNTTYTWDPNTGASYVDGKLAIAPGGKGSRTPTVASAATFPARPALEGTPTPISTT